MTVEIKDILLKAAEDVQQGMWCKGTWFESPDGALYLSYHLFDGTLTVATAQASQRCAQGSIALATFLLGGDIKDAHAASDAVDLKLGDSLISFNDCELPNDPFEAGQQLAELFRTTAQAL